MEGLDIPEFEYKMIYPIEVKNISLIGSFVLTSLKNVNDYDFVVERCKFLFIGKIKI